MSQPPMETDNEESNDVSTPLPVTDTDIATPVLASSKKVFVFCYFITLTNLIFITKLIGN